MEIKTTITNHLKLVRKTSTKKDLLGVSPAEGIGKTELSFILYWDVNVYRNYGKQHRGSLKKKSKHSEAARSGSPTPRLRFRESQN